MPEYLAPGVYVEEIDTGNKPIEGVSTSTAGMFGATERGPVDVPILVTSFGEYRRWFGGYLRAEDFPDENPSRPRRHLPHAVEGFFRNGGKRVYVVRVMSNAADNASRFLFDRGTAAGPASQLLARAAAGDTAVYLAESAAIPALPAGSWIGIDRGPAVEYRQVDAGAPVGAASDVALRLPLAHDHASGVTVEHFTALGAAMGTVTLDDAVEPDDLQLRVSGAGAIAAGDLLRLGDPANGDDEYLVAAGEAPAEPAARTVTLRSAARLGHAAGANLVTRLPALGAPAAAGDTTTLTADAQAGASVLFLADRTNFTAGEFVHVSDGNESELRRIGSLSSLGLRAASYSRYARGALAERVTLTNDVASTGKLLQRDVQAGDSVLELDDRQSLAAGDLVRIGSAADPHVEFIEVLDVPSRLPGPDAGRLILATALQHPHLSGSQARRQSVQRFAAADTVASLALPTERNEATLILTSSMALAAGNALRVTLGANTRYYHQASGAATTLTPAPVNLQTALAAPHTAGAPVAARDPLLQVVAIDAGAWGNRLRVSAQDQSAPLLRTTVREVIDATNLRLSSATGVEPGTVLEHTGGGGATTDLKVTGVDRRNDYLVSLDPATPLPGTAANMDAVRSREFQLDVYLLRAPDPAVPGRNDTPLDSESFRYLSLDHRHSRYIHKVIGTTWTPGASEDHDERPLRLADRRSEGESSYIRVRDQLADPNDWTATYSLRLGPESQRTTPTSPPARLSLANGNDSVAQLDDAAYIGQDSREPEQRTGLHSLKNEDEVSIVACPGRTSSFLQGALIGHCEEMRFRFAVLDGPPPPNDSLNDVESQRQQYDTKYAALYHPWLLIPDPFPLSLTGVPDYPIPPSGHMVGLYARTDIDRGVHKAPANEVVRGITGLQRKLNKGEHDILNPYPVNINVIRDFRLENRGIRAFGARCITSDPDWKYVNVRRLLIFIEASLDRGLQWVVFEPNAEPLWARVRRSIGNFLTTVWRNGALEGTTRAEAYFVKCDRTTMTQTDIDNGRLICVIGVAPVKPAEFVIIRIGLWTAHADEE